MHSALISDTVSTWIDVCILRTIYVSLLRRALTRALHPLSPRLLSSEFKEWYLATVWYSSPFIFNFLRLLGGWTGDWPHWCFVSLSSSVFTKVIGKVSIKLFVRFGYFIFDFAVSHYLCAFFIFFIIYIIQIIIQINYWPKKPSFIQIIDKRLAIRLGPPQLSIYNFVLSSLVSDSYKQYYSAGKLTHNFIFCSPELTQFSIFPLATSLDS